MGLVCILTPGFQHYVAVPVSVPISVSVAVSATVSLKTVSAPAVPYTVAGACARQAQEAGRRVSRAKKWAEFQRVRTAGTEK